LTSQSTFSILVQPPIWRYHKTQGNVKSSLTTLEALKRAAYSTVMKEDYTTQAGKGHHDQPKQREMEDEGWEKDGEKARRNSYVSVKG
jgi:hypothetical protein